ncbi:M23 family metallopeptidase [Sphingobium sp. CAP-1]|uniref:M23 family metallopeptidase n=1 Tax=Sphingobium sp. CAP-1 TaxID=2676077 RepID=UPI0012BB4248|nr:M23 family metallopeptidase [Sphingobium sp. CAP-1]QGP79713.1 peptidoglycan DD-metalloendopeptidase family protein [Sphingobium sp. CAP-1]
MMRRVLLLLMLLCCGAQPLRATASDKDEQAFRHLFGGWKAAQDRKRQTAPAQRVPLVAPAPSRQPISGGIGFRTDPILHRPRYHAGVDLPEPTGVPVYATADGQVGTAGWARGYGLLVTIRHASGYETRYAHMSRLAVTPGEALRRGRLIGYVGSTGRSTGPHLHYEVRLHGQAIDPVNFMRPGR